MRQLETALKAAADPTRTRILKLLEGGELCVCELQAVLRLAPSTVSKHVALLKAAGLVCDRRDGRWIHYSLDGSGHNPYAGAVLHLVGGALRLDPQIRADRKRLEEVLAMPPAEVCAMALPPRPARARAAKAGRRRRAGG